MDISTVPWLRWPLWNKRAVGAGGVFMPTSCCHFTKFMVSSPTWVRSGEAQHMGTWAESILRAGAYRREATGFRAFR